MDFDIEVKEEIDVEFNCCMCQEAFLFEGDLRNHLKSHKQ